MKNASRHRHLGRRLTGALLLAAAALGLHAPARAENHALIMTIDYAGSRSELFPAGLEADGLMASQMAEGMGVPRQNIIWLRNLQLTARGMLDALLDLAQNRVREGDKVFVFYSGHGTQVRGPEGGSKCHEGMVTADGDVFFDIDLQKVLQMLADKASQVVMLNNSCFSGGQATKSAQSPRADGAVPLFTRVSKAGSAADAGYQCGDAVNMKALTKSLGVVDTAKSARMLYVAAAADNEVGWMTRMGGVATQAWARCLQDGAADGDRNGLIDGDELRQCAQGIINRGKAAQTVTLVGASKLPLSFLGSQGGSAPVSNAAGALESLRAGADPSIRVELRVANPRLQIKRDMLDFSVTLDRPGYLYLLHLGTDGQYYLLYPNERDSANKLPAGNHRFPRDSWALQAQGPAGKGYFMAYWSAAPKDFSKALSKDGPFASAKPTTSSVRSLGVVAMDQRYGASAVTEISEVP